MAGKTQLKLILGTLALCFSLVAHADSASERREFLSNLGFDDVPKAIREKLAKNDYRHELNRRQMEYNAVTYEVLNASRELSMLIVENAEVNEKLALFAAKMLALKPLAPATDYPASLLNIEAEGEKEAALVQWLHDERVRQMNIHKNRLLSDIVTLAFDGRVEGNETSIRRMDKLLNTIVDRLYMDDSIGNGKYFGRALAALVLREERLPGDGRRTLERTMSQELKARYNMRFENFFGDTMVMETPEGDKKYKVENGTMMLTRNLAPGSLQISWAAIPKDLVARWKARFKGLIGTPIAAPLFVTAEDTANGIDLWMRIRDRISQGGVLREGFSHIVYYQVKEDPKTGIKMPRVIDNYPSRVADHTDEYIRTGGTRLTYPEQVIDMSHHAAVYFANPVPEKVQEWSQKNKAENGYKGEFFPSTELQLENGLIPTKSTTVANWKTSISEPEFERLHSEPNANKLSKNLFQRFANGLEKTVVNGYTFHWPDPYDFYLVSATYCSQLGDMVMRDETAMPLEQSKSQWHWLLKFFANIGRVGQQLQKVPALAGVGAKLLKLPSVEKSLKITAIEIISPTTLAMQPFMKGEFFRFGSRTPEQRIQSSFMTSDYRESDTRLTSRLEQELGLTRYGTRKTNVILDHASAMRDFEYGIVMRASRGLKTLNFDIEKIAELAVEKESPQVTRDFRARSCRALWN